MFVFLTPFQLRFLFASNPEVMSRVLGIVYRVISGALHKKAGFTRKQGVTGAVTLIQRFGSKIKEQNQEIKGSDSLISDHLAK